MPNVDPNAPTPPGGTIAPAPVSPTGEAILPAKYVPMAMGLASLPAGIGGLLAAAAATGLTVPPHLAAWLGVASGALWLALGVISPGLRRPPTVVLAIAATFLLLWSSPAMAQVNPQLGPEPGCLGLVNLHCGISASFLGLRPGLTGSPVPVELGAGPSAEYHWQKWSLGGAVFGNAVLPLVLKSQPTSEVTGAVFAGLDGLLKAFNSMVATIAAGLRLGVSVVIAGPDGGLTGGFTWKRSVGLVLSGSPELLSYAQTALPAQ